jgi:hypothetical protein
MVVSPFLIGFIILHLLAAFYHQFVRKDGLFQRMFFGRRVLNPMPSEVGRRGITQDCAPARRANISRPRSVKVAPDVPVTYSTR